MRGLSETPALRAAILTPTTGTKTKVALRESWENAAEDLRIALEVGATTADAVVEAFAPDDRVRYLDAKALWAYVAEGDFWKTPAGAAQDVAKSHVAFMLTQGLRDHLLTHRDIVEGVTVPEIATRLPRNELGRIIESALERGHRSLAFGEKELLDDMPPERLVDHIPLAHIWRNVVCERIADVHGYSSTAESPKSDGTESGWSNHPPPEVPARGHRSSKRPSKRPRGAG